MSADPKPCGCIAAVNVHLRERGYELEVGNVCRIEGGQPTVNLGRPTLMRTVKISSHKSGRRTPRIWGRFCPFCGHELWAEATDTPPHAD